MTERYGYDKTPTPPIDYDMSKVPSEIKKRTEWVMSKYTGEDVAEAYRQAGDIAGIYAGEAKKIAEDTQYRQDAVEDFNTQVIQEMTDKDVISAPELIESRDGEDKLSARLARDKTEILHAFRDLTVSVKSLGAKGDETTDDFDAIQATIDHVHSLGGGNMLIPEGVFIVTPTMSRKLILKDGVNWLGNGNSVIKVSDNNPNFDVLMTGVGAGTALSNVVFSGVTFDTNVENNNQTVNVNNRRLIMRYELADNLNFDNCKFYYSGMNAILATGAMYGHRNLFVTSCYFKFSPANDIAYDNTAIFIGTIGHVVKGNVFEGHFNADHSKTRAVTAYESHSSYSIFEGNIISEFGSGVLLLGADYGTSDVTDKSLVQKVVSNNIMRKMHNGITVWADTRDVNHMIITGNIIDINNKDRDRISPNSYGIALSHSMGAVEMNASVTDVLIAGNSIKFQEDQSWLLPGANNGEEDIYMGGFGIGCLGSFGHRVKLRDVIIRGNVIKNSPKQPFVFANESTEVDQYKNIIIKQNTIINPFTHSKVATDYRALLLLYGTINGLTMTDNDIIDDRSKPLIIKEVFFRGALSGFKNIKVMDNDFRNLDVGLLRHQPIWAIPTGAVYQREDRSRVQVFSTEAGMNDKTFVINDVYILSTASATGTNIAICGKSGTKKTLTTPLSGVASGNQISVDSLPFKCGEFVDVTNVSTGSVLITGARVIGVDRVNSRVVISDEASGNVTLQYSQPVFTVINKAT